MAWKDYFYFTRAERNGIAVLVVLIIGIILFPYIYQWIKPSGDWHHKDAEEKIARYHSLFEEYIAAREAFEAERERALAERAMVRIELTPFRFDPNDLDISEFAALGLPERIARNIINYRNAGGTFRFREDFKRIYSIDEDLYAELESYINLPARPQPGQRASQTADLAYREKNPDQVTRPFQPSPVLININQADTTEWQQIRGIGPVFSRRITAYRELLGGYYSLDQLKEVYGMDSARFEQITPFIHIDSIPETRKINVNLADFATLLRHPYLNRNQVNSIVRMREMHGPFQAMDELLRSELIHPEDLRRLTPYLTLNPDDFAESD